MNDSVTGFPEVGPKQFWRIYPEGVKVYVELRKRRFWGSTLLAAGMADPEPQAIRVEAAYLVLRVKRAADMESKFADLVGDYPPKRLGVADD